MQGESGENRGSISPIEPLRRRRWPASGQPCCGGQGAVGFVARRQCIHQYTFLLASRPGPLGLPSKLIYRRDRALGSKALYNNRQSDEMMPHSYVGFTVPPRQSFPVRP